jgi:hypothetical protein
MVVVALDLPVQVDRRDGVMGDQMPLTDPRGYKKTDSSPMEVSAQALPGRAASAPAVSGCAPRPCWLVILMALRIASQRCGVFTASVRLRSWLAGILRYLPAAIDAGTIGASS